MVTHEVLVDTTHNKKSGVTTVLERPFYVPGELGEEVGFPMGMLLWAVARTLLRSTSADGHTCTSGDMPMQNTQLFIPDLRQEVGVQFGESYDPQKKGTMGRGAWLESEVADTSFRSNGVAEEGGDRE
ncbi:hypothetical protein J6590_093406 [Homalodisca vitripennis]|nr:hypothetical protein J6590_084998 [Homalodisca vitripennis]KAG8329154.1 hypothetical protein J6590_093406 [Homalodisca vitripennis]